MNEQNLPVRKVTRLPEFDYTRPGAYFVTICTKNRQNLFWRRPDVGADNIRPYVVYGDWANETQRFQTNRPASLATLLL